MTPKDGLPVRSEAVDAAIHAMQGEWTGGRRYADLMSAAIKAFLEAEGFEVEHASGQHLLGYDIHRLVSKWVPDAT